MNERHWRKAAAAAVLGLALAAPAEAFLRLGDGRPASFELATEYYHEKLGEFVVTVSRDEIDALDGAATPAWQRTGFTFYAVDGPVGAGQVLGRHPVAVPVCRFFIPPASHFLSASEEECAALAARVAGAVLETDAAFYAWLPDEDGRCPRLFAKIGGFAFAPVYRLWDSAQGTAHRLTASKELRDAMVASGWTAEGSGPDGVAMCVPSWGAR